MMMNKSEANINQNTNRITNNSNNNYNLTTYNIQGSKSPKSNNNTMNSNRTPVKSQYQKTGTNKK